jgi:hypothetical protein
MSVEFCIEPLSPNPPAPATIVEYRRFFNISSDQNLVVDAFAAAPDAGLQAERLGSLRWVGLRLPPRTERCAHGSSGIET